MTQPSPLADLGKGLGAIAFNILAVLSTYQQQIEWWGKMIALGLGCIVSVLTCISLIKGLRKR